MSATRLIRHFDRVIEAPDAVPKLRKLVVELACAGRLSIQNDEERKPEAALAKARSWLLRESPSVPRANRKVSVEIAPDNVPGALPANWIAARLNDVGFFVNGLAFKPSDWKESGRPIIRIQNLSDPTKPFNYAQGEFAEEVTVRDGDILVSWSATLDAFVWNRGEGILNQHIFRVIPAEAIVDPRFLLLLLKQAIRNLAASEHAHGLVMAHINRGPFLDHVVGIPPLAEQRRIVAKVDEVMGLCDRLEAARDERARRRARLVRASAARLDSCAGASDRAAMINAAALHMNRLSDLTKTQDDINLVRQTVLNLGVLGRLTHQDRAEESGAQVVARIRDLLGPEKSRKTKSSATTVAGSGRNPLPDGWAATRLGDICSMVTSGSRGWAEFYSKSGPKFLRAQNIRFGRLRLDELACVTPPKGTEGNRTQVSIGDLVVVITGAGVTNPALVDRELGEAYVSQHVALIKPGLPSISQWLLLCLMAPAAARADLVRRAYGAGKPGLNLENVRSLIVPIPPLAEQRRVVARVDELMAVCDRLQEQLDRSETARNRLFDALLNDALAIGA